MLAFLPGDVFTLLYPMLRLADQSCLSRCSRRTYASSVRQLQRIEAKQCDNSDGPYELVVSPNTGRMCARRRFGACSSSEAAASMYPRTLTQREPFSLRLFVSEHQRSKIALAQLSREPKFSRLRSLEVKTKRSGSFVECLSCAPLAKLTSLVSLRVQPRASQLSCLSALRALEALDVQVLNRGDTQHLPPSLTSLKSLTLPGVRHLSRLTRLQCLEISSSHVNAAHHFDHLTRLRSTLTRLVCARFDTDDVNDGVGAQMAWPALRSLECRPVGGNTLRGILQMTSLTHLSMGSQYVHGQTHGLSVWTLPHLRSLSLHALESLVYNGAEEHAATRSGMPMLTELHLEYLSRLFVWTPALQKLTARVKTLSIDSDAWSIFPERRTSFPHHMTMLDMFYLVRYNHSIETRDVVSLGPRLRSLHLENTDCICCGHSPHLVSTHAESKASDGCPFYSVLLRGLPRLCNLHFRAGSLTWKHVAELGGFVDVSPFLESDPACDQGDGLKNMASYRNKLLGLLQGGGTCRRSRTPQGMRLESLQFSQGIHGATGDEWIDDETCALLRRKSDPDFALGARAT